MKHQYICVSCGAHLTLPSGSRYCPICSGTVESKSENYAKSQLQELEKLLPALELKYNEFANIYAQFKRINETLRTYAARGLIDRDSIPDFKPETLTNIFFQSRWFKS